MAKLFSNRNVAAALSPRQSLTAKYNAARMNLLLVLAFTLINIAIVAFGGTSYFLFSASVPYYLAFMGAYLCGKMPEDLYEDYANLEFYDSSIMIIMIVIAVVILALYLVGWIFSAKNRGGWLIFSLALFAIDTVGMFLLMGVSADSILDLLFHVWVLYYLGAGVYAHFKLKTLPPEEETAAPATEADPFAAPFEEKPFDDGSDGTTNG